MLKQELLNKLKNEYKIIRFKPLCSTSDYEYKSTLDGTFTFENPNTKFFKRIAVEVITENLFTGDEEHVGEASFCVINPSIYEDDALHKVINYDKLSAHLMLSMDYINHEESYKEYLFPNPYQPFIVLSGLYIEEPYRRNGIGAEVIKYAPELINAMFNLNITHVFWRNWPVDSYLNELESTTEDALMELSNFAESISEHFFWGQDDDDYEYRYYVKEDT